MLDESEFLSPYGIRSLSRVYRDRPYTIRIDRTDYRVDYEPAESRTGRFGGNSNWRGPIWFPVNYLIIESLQKFHYFLGNEFQVECPTGSGHRMNLWDVSLELERRLTRIFLQDENRMATLKGSETHANLKRAFANEAEANRRYVDFAWQADIEGYPEIAGLFRDTAEGETGHANGHMEFLKRLGDPITDLPHGRSE